MSDPVLDLLKEKGIAYSISGKDYLTKCLNPDHNDSNPSFRIDKTTGISHCFSCGFKANIFKHFGILTNNVSVRIAKLKNKLNDLRQANDGLDPIKNSKAFTTSYRGVSASTLKYFGAFTTDSEEALVDRICFPLTDVRDKTMAYIGRSMLSDAGQRYANYPPGVSLPLFPAKVESGTKSIVLVEGLFDFLNCYDKGLHNVVACFGTSKLYKDTGVKLFPYKVMGVEKVYIMYDADDAGKEAAKRLKPLIEDCEFTVEIINLPNGTDPGDLTQEYVDSIIEYTK